MDIPDASGRLGIGRETARSHLKKVFAKTRVSRQADLVALLSNLSPGSSWATPVADM